MSKGVAIVFTKAPEAGKVKTRLIPGIGSNRATNIYKQLLKKTIHTVRKSDLSEIHLYVDGNINHSFFREIRRRHPVRLYQQQGNDLGQRMFRTFHKVLKKYSYAVLIGSDCPGLSTADLNQAKESLAQGMDIVLGPANDGGYYLIGLSKNDVRLFNKIRWGGSTVFDDTMSRVERLGWQYSILAQHWDLDRTADLLAYIKLKNTGAAIY